MAHQGKSLLHRLVGSGSSSSKPLPLFPLTAPDLNSRRCLDLFGDIALEADVPLGLGADDFAIRSRVPFRDRGEREELRDGQGLIVGRDGRAVLLLVEVAVLRRMPAQGGRGDTGRLGQAY